MSTNNYSRRNFLKVIGLGATTLGAQGCASISRLIGGKVSGDNGNLSLIRELHIYGPEVPLSQQKEEAAQHKGLGKALLKEAERIAAQEFQVERMVVLSGVGAREYYRSEFGYSSFGDYMVKNL